MIFLLIVCCSSQNISGNYQILEANNFFDFPSLEKFAVSTLMVNNVKIPYYSSINQKFDEVTILIPHKYGEALRYVSIQQFKFVMEELYPNDAYKTEFLIKELENKKPEEISFFKNKIETVEKNDRRSETVHKNIPYEFLNVFSKWVYNYDSDYILYYNCMFVPNVVNQYYQCEKTGRPFAATIKYRDNLSLVNIANTDELPIEKLYRTSNTIQKIILNPKKAKQEYTDYIEILMNSYTDLKSCEINEKIELSQEKANITSQVKKLISKQIDIHQPSVNLYGVQIPNVAVIPLHEKKIIYINSDQVAQIMKNTKNVHDWPVIILNVAALVISLLLSALFNGKKLRNLLLFVFFAFSTFIILYLLVQISDSKIVKLLVTIVTFNWWNTDELESMRKREKMRKEGRVLMRNAIKNYVNGRNNFYLLKTELSLNNVFDVTNIYDFD